MKLSCLSVGKSAKIIALNFKGKNAKRLEELGFTRGAIVKVIRFSPLGDIMLIKVRNFYLGLRVADASKVIVGEYE